MMLTYEYINKEWIVSSTASRVYRISACWSLALAVFWWVWLGGRIPTQLRPITQPLVFVGILGAAATLVGMQYFLFRFDDSHPLIQMFWFVILLLPLIGPPLYCFIVYSRAKVLKQACEKQASDGRHDVTDFSVRRNRTYAV